VVEQHDALQQQQQQQQQGTESMHV
jgi:hypothetical protein